MSPPRIIENRYQLLRLIGTGAFGEVWEAKDRLADERVALKWMYAKHGAMQPHVRREITSLRLLRFPGVVRFLDDGVADDKPFLVMELVNGLPFPGGLTSGPVTWNELAAPTLALLETLAHVHAAGVIHRDLKPANVLVRPDGRPMVLDFGISQLQTVRIDRNRRRRRHSSDGSPLYMSPEQIGGDELDARTDLYAVGLMLYESLTGVVPHDSKYVGTLFRNRLTKSVRPVQELAPSVPPNVAAVINQLLEKRPEDRFASATEVLAALRGETVDKNNLRFLGSQERLDEIANRLARGQSVDLVGIRGSGRTRWLREIADRLTRQDRRLTWVQPSRSPRGSLLPLLDDASATRRMRPEEALAWTEDSISRMLESGTILVVDDAEGIDPWSAEILLRCRSRAGSMIRAFLSTPPNHSADDVVHVPLLDESSLQALFAGPDRLFHLREDAARALWERTNGHPGQIESELLSWMRMGLARRDGSLFHVDREALSHLQAGLFGVRVAESSYSDALLNDPHARDLMRWLSLARCPLSLAQLTELMQCAPSEVETASRELLQRGLIKTNDGIWFEIRWRMQAHDDEERRTQAHRALATTLEPGSDMRLYHWLAADSLLEAAREAVQVATRKSRLGDLRAASALLAEGLRAARDERAAEEESSILTLWTKTALAEGTPLAMDRVLYEIARTRPMTPELARLDVLLRAAIAAPGGGCMQALEMADDLGPFSDPELERWRHNVRIVAVAVRASAPMIAQVLHDVETWAEESDEPLAHLCLAAGRGRQRYHEGHFEEAATSYARAAALESSIPARIRAMLRSASALLEAFRYEDAAQMVNEAKLLAAQFRIPNFEGRAEWILRSVEYRTGKTAHADIELVDAATLVGDEHIEALICLNEAAAAMRGGALHVAQDLANRAAIMWRRMDRPYATMTARALAIACGATTTDDDEVQTLSKRARECDGAGIGIQTLGLLARVFPEMRSSWQDGLDELVRNVPRSHWKHRMDVLSVNEAWTAITGSPP